MAVKKIDQDSPAVQAHLGILQAVIQRMASNSSGSKTWCITIVAAILVIIADKGNYKLAFITIIPIVLFFILDAYYLALEKGFRNAYNNFVRKLHDESLEVNDLYVVNPSGNLFFNFLASIISFSVWPFYMTLIIMILVVIKYVIV